MGSRHYTRHCARRAKALPMQGERMAMSLREALRSMLSGWQADLDPEWRKALDGVQLAFEAVDAELELHPWEPIFPSRRQFPLPGAPAGAHLFRAFDDLNPEDVRCVLIGQDPYPSIAFSTGRAFESGEHRHWRELENMGSCSMRSLIQSLCAFRSGRRDHARETDGWAATIEAIEAAGNGFPQPPRLAQHWVGQGALLLNASLTISRFAVAGDPHQVNGHLPLWRPLMAHLIRCFAERGGRPAVFMLFGEAARQAAVASGVVEPGEIDEHPLFVASPHPAAGNGFLRSPNPFIRCNEKLQALQARPIHW